MSFESLMAAAQRLSVSAEALAALGAQLRLLQEGESADPRIGALLHEVAQAIDPQLLEGIDVQGAGGALSFVQTVFRQAQDLLENPGRAVGWSFSDPVVLQSQGQLSRLVVRAIEVMAAQQPEMGAALRGHGVLLDIGSGVGWLAIEAARTWPALRVVGIEPWEPALALARTNLFGSDVAARVDFFSLRVEELAETQAFTIAWLPGPFMAPEVVDRALPRIHRALVPGGWLIFGLSAPPRDALEEALSNLRAVRWGGQAWISGDVEERLRRHGYTQIASFAPALPIRAVVARRAA